MNPFALCTADEDGVVLIEPVRSIAPAQKLVYSEYDPLTDTYTATLSPSQKRILSDCIHNAFGTTGEPVTMTVRSRKGEVFIDFRISLSCLSQGVILASYPGLSVFTLHRTIVGMCWEVGKSSVQWPVWLKAKA